MPKKLILDVDTGTDDAVALMLAALHPDLELVAATTVNGNNPVANCTDNTLRVFDLLGRRHPGLRRSGDARWCATTSRSRARSCTGQGSMHGLELPIPAPRSVKQAQRAVEFLVETYMAATEPITLVPVGPLTNIAMAIKLEPRIVERIPATVIMGGGHASREHDALAEFNIWVDPEAARVVFGPACANVTLVPLDATHRALVSLEDCGGCARWARRPGDAAAAFIEGRIDAYDTLQPMDTLRTAPGPRCPVRRLPRRPDGRQRPARPRRRRDPRRADDGPHGHRHPRASPGWSPTPSSPSMPMRRSSCRCCSRRSPVSLDPGRLSAEVQLARASGDDRIPERLVDAHGRHGVLDAR